MILYNTAIYVLKGSLWLASWLNPKARAFVSGRKKLWSKLRTSLSGNTAPIVWVHCASLGEFEQGRPIIEAFKKEMPQYKVLLSFFSPSGYEVRKNYAQADYVFYLPIDTPANARRWVSMVQPALTIFVKYEFWFNYTEELRKRNLPRISVSAIFRPSQAFFKSYGKAMQAILRNFNFFFVQTNDSGKLLKSIGITNYMLAGDTRFDRVHQITQSKEEIPVAKKFKRDEKVMVAGSCWPEDIDVLAPLINERQLKFIIAPHEIDDEFLSSIQKMLEVNSVRYSQAIDMDERTLEEFQVLLIDNIGMLSRLYRYGEFAYIGGAFGKGLHNILEAACYGIPIFFGNKNYQKFNEANDLIMRGGAFEVADFSDLKAKYEMVNIPETFLLACEVTRSYVEENLGATDKIISYCRKILSKP